jgi:hypothetical protein
MTTMLLLLLLLLLLLHGGDYLRSEKQEEAHTLHSPRVFGRSLSIPTAGILSCIMGHRSSPLRPLHSAPP